MSIAVTDTQNRAATLLQELIRRADVGEALAWLKAFVERLGFAAEILTFEGTPNLWATRRSAGDQPILGFLGHADVVPVGEGWAYPPFAGVIEEGAVWGRGAVDMKGGIACFLAAVEAALAQEEAQGEAALPGLELLISGDEEGLAVGGTPAVLQALAAQGRSPEWQFVLVGEPTSHARLGDLIKVGCRGSLNVRVMASGQSGHVAYPAFSANPVPPLMAFLERAKALIERDDEAVLERRVQVDMALSEASVLTYDESRSLFPVSPSMNEMLDEERNEAVGRRTRTEIASEGRFVPACKKTDTSLISSPSSTHEALAETGCEGAGMAFERLIEGANSEACALQKVPFANFGLRVLAAEKAVFEPSHMEVTAFQAGGEATNIVPAQAEARFNVRFSPPMTAETLITTLEGLAQKLAVSGVTFALAYDKAGSPVLSVPSPAHEVLAEVVQEVTGELPERSAKGANSDARFLQGVTFAELGLRVQEAHQPNEKVRLEDLEQLTQIYKTFLMRFGLGR